MPLSGEAKKAYDRKYGKANRKRLNAKSLAWHHSNKDRSKDIKLRCYYRISIDDYQKMLVEQHGVCAICHKPEIIVCRGSEIKALSVDHNHATGKIRGLLCDRCNRALGFMDDDPAKLIAAANYLEKYK
jgi:hypothetical protein